MFNKNRDTGTYSEVNVVQNTIDKANSASLLDIFHSYSINMDYNHAACCPFPFHKGGQERSASFHYYKDTNSFYCFGCKTGGGAVDFVSRYEDLNRYNAALVQGVFDASHFVYADALQKASHKTASAYIKIEFYLFAQWRGRL